MARFGSVDVPVDGTVVAREGFIVSGFACQEDGAPFKSVIVRSRGREAGTSSLHHYRPDVRRAILVSGDGNCGFRVTVSLPDESPGTQTLDVTACFENGATWEKQIRVRIGPNDYRKSPYGTLADGNVNVIYGREHIYGFGPPSGEASVECVALLKSHLSAGETVIDVGCGVGAYAEPLMGAGVLWHGCDVNAAFVDNMRERNLPVTLIESDWLPFADKEFESAICIEVLEHIAEYEPLVWHIARITRRMAFFSVPNAAAIPILADRLVVPWHLLEADHKNFFNATSLKTLLSRHFRTVEVIPYGTMPIMSSNDTPVYYHLLAMCEA